MRRIHGVFSAIITAHYRRDSPVYIPYVLGDNSGSILVLQKGYIVKHKRSKKKRSNPIARDLRTPKYRQRVVRDKKKYTRKGVKIYGENLREGITDIPPPVVSPMASLDFH